MKKLCIGIDPGKDGYVVTYNDVTGNRTMLPIPKIGDKVDVHGIYELFGVIKTAFHDYSIQVCIEDVHAIFGASAKSTFEFGYINGILEMAIVSCGFSYTKVAPKKWQSLMWQGVPIQKKVSSTGKTLVNNTKAISEMAARRLFPDMDFRRTTRCKNNDENLIDALLICEYCRRNF